MNMKILKFFLFAILFLFYKDHLITNEVEVLKAKRTDYQDENKKVIKSELILTFKKSGFLFNRHMFEKNFSLGVIQKPEDTGGKMIQNLMVTQYTLNNDEETIVLEQVKTKK